MALLKPLPGKLLDNLEGVAGYDRADFVAAHETGKPITSIRLNPWKNISGQQAPFSFALDQQVPWSRHGYYLTQRPSFTFDPLFHAGLYYVQEASSMFLEQALLQLLPANQDLSVLDLCGAPGGKSTHIQSLISPGSLLVSNEVIKSRSHVLQDNIIKWGARNVIVTSNDPRAFQKLGGFFDLMVVDAPCSGSGLFRRDPDAIDEWSVSNVQLCSQRQQRILADALPALREDGLLVYATCSYSSEEDEQIADWLVEEMGMESLQLETAPHWNIITTQSAGGAYGYRFYPYKVQGEGFFMACFRKKSAQAVTKIRGTKPEMASSKEMEIIRPWLKPGHGDVIREGDHFFALPETLTVKYASLRAQLHLVYAGVQLGQIMKGRLVPAHALSQSNLVAPSITVNQLGYEDAVRYLQKGEMEHRPAGQGWQLVAYEGQNLGWINVLPNRINNYYPKELRILKQQNDSDFKK